MTLRNLFKTLACLTAASLAAGAFAASKAEHVLLVVWDGMRPDFVSPAYCPTLYGLARDGVFFANHHPVYISSTEVNGTALATGVYPNRSGVIANSEYRPEIGWLGPNATEGLEMIRRTDLITGGNYIRVRTVPEILHAANIETVVAGTKPVAMMHDRSGRRTGAAKNSPVIFNGQSIPTALIADVEKVNDNKKFPTNATPNTGRDEWTVKGLTQVLWKKGVPKYSVLWLSEPDASQHASSPGSENAVNALDSSDKRLAAVLKVLEDKKVRDKTDVLVVSDHGFSTISRGFDLTEMLKRAGIRATKKFDDAEPGDVMVVPLGGSALIYVVDHDAKVIERVVEFLQSTDVAGVIFSQLDIKGTFPLSTVRMDAAKTAPDLVVSFRWTEERNEFGARGTVYAEGGKRGSGTHASLSRFDMHNTLIASGPSFRRGFVDTLPSSNADVAPTILALFDVKAPEPMDGRVLSEALVNGKAPSGEPKQQTIEASREVGMRQWRQYLKTTTFGGAFYVDEGNGESDLK
jgi:predicted AlkP superfamily pyrophosphatase or phosphodiesterase